ncbi:ras-specific guanine nucleotide-releasing factor RalGPS2 isoform X1 [Leguminivora glycinivorella]|uniref:ras-specific guanine nucleotide-releasing factor RalGPS2 isoform X1 n=1 Tax=Leguminivora glycinivorella TaxID=1035111 RepID=UPI00200F6605|nr:ras-specific guanine nucleotide-releasing factor RalGPS2 isoform X1 [Leguminivora glycinivorella]XP_048005167.1 ras-specific guanine nucleotide-releasing factor RalGPS2 isoform X1 [Leguminivora glycinivorella]
MPRDILSDSLSVLSIVEHEDEENWPLEEKPSCRQNDKKAIYIPLNGQKTKDDCACYYNYGLGDGSNNRQLDPIYQYKTSSLPAASSINQSWDEVVCSALRLSPEDIANQLTLLDLPCFKAIQPDELTTCCWNKANKQTVAPNVVAFTKRFNRVSFWTVQEVLNGQSPKARAETLAHFIKVAKKLHDLNNLHSLFAVISALNSASIYRLTKTWACLSKKDKQQFDKLAELFGEEDNWTALREYLKSISLPCIPFMGIFLTDLTYINIAHPARSPHRTAKMAVVLKTIEKYQTSEYDITPLPHVAIYLNSVRYIEELQKFLEDDQYKLSQKLEPPSPVGSCAGSRESVQESGAAGAPAAFSLSPSHRLGSGSLRLHTNYTHSKFIPTHRKCRSLGSNIFGKGQSDEKTPAGSVNLLDDTLLESPGSVVGDKLSHSLPHANPKAEASECLYEGFVRRKIVLRDGKKVSLASWQRYWLLLHGQQLDFFAAKSFKGCLSGSTGRSDFREERYKSLPLESWTATRGESPDSFQLIHQHGTLYKFKTGSDTTAMQWWIKIQEVTNKMVKPLPANLMQFE